jgi:hypothetical protein
MGKNYLAKCQTIPELNFKIFSMIQFTKDNTYTKYSRDKQHNREIETTTRDATENQVTGTILER